MTVPVDLQVTTRNDAVAFATLGFRASALYQEIEAEFVYVKVVDLAVAAGDVLTVAAAANPWTVTKDRAGGSATAGHPVVGVAVGTISAGQFGFILVKGYHPSVKDTGGAVAAGDRLVADPVNDGSALSVAIPATIQAESYPFAEALGNVAANVVPCLVKTGA